MADPVLSNVINFCDQYSTCSSFKSAYFDGNRCGSFNSSTIEIGQINQYWCIFRTITTTIGSSYNNTIETKTVGKDIDDINCSTNTACVLNRINVQNSCDGHKLPVGDYRGKIDDFPRVRIGSKITSEFFDQLADIVNFQIEERYKSAKYKNIPNYNQTIEHINKSTNDEKITYTGAMSNLINAISALQPDNNCDQYNASEKNKTLSAMEYGLIGSSEAGYIDGTKKKKSLVLNKENIKKISDVIKKDLNDCVCYSDCNGYSICFCYGNCNHY